MVDSVFEFDVGGVQLDFDEDAGWAKGGSGDVMCWFAGHLDDGSQGQTAAKMISKLLDERIARGSGSEFAAVLQTIDGQFALAARSCGWSFATVDPIRSIPLSFIETPSGMSVGPSGIRLAEASGLIEFDADAVLCFAMAGYTIGRTTVYRDLFQLMPGEFLFAKDDQAPEIGCYWAYCPQGRDRRDRATLRHALVDATLQTLENLVASSKGRSIVVPLSAGLDSRLIVSGLHHMGIRDVRCYAYGRAGNFEAEASRKIAEHLGYQWTFVPYSLEQQRQTFAGDDHRAYLAFADNLSALAFQQDFHAVQVLKNRGFFPADAIIVNGQSGDYLTGNHIPTELCEAPLKLDKESRRTRIISSMIEKHFSHWQILKSPANLMILKNQLRRELATADLNFDREIADDYGIFESLEFRNRQAKYVIGGQRAYDFYGLDWRLPLWDKVYMSFWQEVPLEAKQGRNLFQEMLLEQNWGGVWQGWNFPQRVTPVSFAALRFALKALHAPFGSTHWHQFERRYLDYFMDLLCNYAVAPYARVARDDRGFRNGLSWHIEAYLKDKGLGLDGGPASA